MNNHKIGFFIASVLTSAAAAAAEPQSVSTPTEAAAELPMVVVTGSSIPTTPDTVAVPVDTLSAAQLEASGVDSNALEMLRKEIPAFEGRSNAGTSNANNNNQNTAGGSQAQLRNLPTLVLVDGRRVATSGIGGINGKNFVDINQIPAAAIDHVDVLTDGASSIYGSDAVGGVVNFALKSDYKGLSAGARAADGTDYGEWNAFAVGGLPVGQGNITAIVNYTHTDPLFQSDRSFSSPLYGKTSALPGTVSGASDILAPGLDSPSARNPTGVNASAASLAALVANGTYLPTSPSAVANGFDISPYQTLLLKQDLASFTSTFNFPVADRDKLALFGDVMVSQDRAWTRWAPVNATGLTVPAGAPFNPLTSAFPGVTFTYLPDGHDFYDTTTAARVTAGLRGEFTPAWTWETAVVYSESDLEQDQTNLLFKPNLALAIAGGYNAAGQPVAGGPYSLEYGGFSPSGPQVLTPALDPFATAAGVNPGSLAHLYGTEVIRAISQLESWDGQIVGRMPGLPAGDVGLAVGATVRREALSGHADPNGRVTDPVTGAYGVNSQLWIGGTFADPFAAARTISGGFAEVRVPLTSDQWSVPVVRAFDLTGAVRSEHYSDAGNSTVPKVGFRWEPFDRQLVFRGNYAKSFLAPNLFSEVGPTDTRQVAGTVIAGVFGPNYNALPFNGEDGNNPNLKAATSTSKTVGFVLKPDMAKGLSVTADYSYIVLKGFQAGIGFNNILSSVNTLGSASPYFANLAIGNFAGLAGSSNPFTAPGALLAYLTNPGTGMGDPAKAANLYLIDRFQNNAELLEESWNIGASYTIPTDRAGIFTVGSTGSIFDSFNFQGLPGQAYIQYAGHATNAGVFGGTLPKYHFYTTLDWAYADFDLGLANTYLSSVTDTGPNGNLAPLPVSRYSAWDARAAYSWGKFKAAVGVNNFTNRMPPLAPRTFTDNNVDVSTYSPIGRLLYATVTMTF
ncbi:MAG TPA: TonB-dependent receptor plug domain-containing protein [Steroidobacteraceae bacterium]|nr:TonB-dependent receptor plug domain-containing protein [Steroidobacteraceae bacterium]